jgi:gluconate 2-dehydrogenase subunit 3-like protein
MSSEDDRSPILLRVAGDPPPSGIARRTALQVLAAAGAALGLPSDALGQHPMHAHLSNPGALEQARQRAAVTTSAPQFADAHQLKTLEALAEAIVPGSTKARVAPFLDQLVAVESPANQRAFLGALGAFDMAAIARHSKPWIAIAATEQDALLQQASTGDAKTSALSGHFQNLKTWVAGAYYSSEIGMRELGWTDNVFHQQLPGCTHPGSHQD